VKAAFLEAHRAVSEVLERRAFHLENIKRRYGKVLALNSLSLSVRQGEIYGFPGRNGAGKTTTPLTAAPSTLSDNRE
jgi:ABC-2 type transport system ATP-binding protein